MLNWIGDNLESPDLEAVLDQLIANGAQINRRIDQDTYAAGGGKEDDIWRTEDR